MEPLTNMSSLNSLYHYKAKNSNLLGCADSIPKPFGGMRNEVNTCQMDA